MAIRIDDPKLGQTEELMIQILQPLIKDDARVSFLCPAGSGPAIMQCIRVMISRKRKALGRQGRKQRFFRLHNTIHPETHDGTRMDCVVVWKSVSEIGLMSQDLQEVLSHVG